MSSHEFFFKISNKLFYVSPSFLPSFTRIRHRQFETQNSGYESLDHPGNGGLVIYKELMVSLWRSRIFNNMQELLRSSIPKW